MVPKKIFCLFSVCLIMLVSGCSLPGGTVQGNPTASDQTGSGGDVQTQVALAVAQTMVAQTVAAVNAPGSTQEQQQPANTPEFTFTPSFTPTATFTNTPGTAIVTVSVETNCRAGPGTPYDALAVLPVGPSAEVIGKYTPSNYWIIHPPSNPSITCWLWGEYATVTGDTSGLQSYTPPPTPTPKYTATPEASFQVVYSSVSYCSAPYYAVNFKITNNGSVTWESNYVKITDQVTSEWQANNWDNFPKNITCTETSYGTNLEPGEVGYTYYELLGNPSGHSIKATIRVCSQDGLTGTCLEKTITFTP